jgi:hypothetical protein
LTQDYVHTNDKSERESAVLKAKPNEYSFEVKLAAIATVRCRNRSEAIRLLNSTIQGVTLNYVEGAVRLTEASLDDCGPVLVEINGKEVDED